MNSNNINPNINKFNLPFFPFSNLQNEPIHYIYPNLFPNQMTNFYSTQQNRQLQASK